MAKLPTGRMAMSRPRLDETHQERPRLAVRQQEDQLIIEVSVHTSDLIQVMQDLTLSDATPDLERRQYDGLLKGDITWRNPILNGKERHFSVEGTRSDPAATFIVIIYGAPAGYGGNGPKEVAHALAYMGIGTEDFLIRLLCTPYPGVPRSQITDVRDAWREVIKGSDFGEQYS